MIPIYDEVYDEGLVITMPWSKILIPMMVLLLTLSALFAIFTAIL